MFKDTLKPDEWRINIHTHIYIPMYTHRAREKKSERKRPSGEERETKAWRKD